MFSGAGCPPGRERCARDAERSSRQADESLFSNDLCGANRSPQLSSPPGQRCRSCPRRGERENSTFSFNTRQTPILLGHFCSYCRCVPSQHLIPRGWGGGVRSARKSSARSCARQRKNRSPSGGHNPLRAFAALACPWLAAWRKNTAARTRSSATPCPSK